jgi:hypothetical protein
VKRSDWPERCARRREGGLTVVELLITLAIASGVSAATFIFFAGQQKIYEVQTEILNLQQNLWASMETLARYTRVSGAGMLGCVRPDSDGPGGPDQGDPVPGGDAMPQTGLRVWLDPNFLRVPPLWIKNGANGAPDIITIAYGESASGTFKDATLALDVDQSTDDIVTLAGESNSFRALEFALLVDSGQTNMDRGCMLFQISAIDIATNTLQHSAAASPWNTLANVAPMVPFIFDGDTIPTNNPTGGVRSFGQLTFVQFAIDSTGAPAVPPRLTMNVLTGGDGPQVLAEGIEDMQIAYACDLQPATPDGILTEGVDAAARLTDEWTYNHASDVEPIGCKRPHGVRITLIARSSTQDNALKDFPENAKPAAEDGALGVVDLYRHRVATVTAYPRNQ